jgi:acyl phosphate:glycerol-3-phosphate acyltransferase
VNIFLSVVALIVAYLLGSIPTAYIIGRMRKGTDIRQVGSRNMGAMNTFYSVGFWWGALVLFADIGKGAASIAIAQALGLNQYVVFAAGLLAIIGHNLPLFLKFKGGKGGATAIGVLIYLMPWSIVICGGLFLALLLITRAPTISYGICFFFFPFVAWLVYHDTPLVVYSIIVGLIPLLRYIPRLQEMRKTGGSWLRVFKRKGLKDRF